MKDEGTHGGSFLDRARSALENVEQDERFKQATAITQEAAEQTRDASKDFSRKLTQQDSWEELRTDVEELTEIVSAHQALIIDLLDRVEALEGRDGG
jgi:hypothetical protein